MHTIKKNNASPLCMLCTLIPQILPLLTLTSVHTKPKDINLSLVGFRITRILTDYAQNLPGHWLAQPLQVLLERWSIS